MPAAVHRARDRPARVGLVGYGDDSHGIHARLLDQAGLPVVAVATANPEHVAQVCAEREVTAVPTTSQQDAVRCVVVGTLFYELVLLTLRHLAQQDAFTRHTDPR